MGDVVLALENAIYSVISPEGCASILWRTPEAAQDAAVAMRLTAGEQQALGVIDVVIPEPAPVPTRSPKETARSLRAAIIAQLDVLTARDVDALRRGALPALPAHGCLRVHRRARARSAASGSG